MVLCFLALNTLGVPKSPVNIHSSVYRRETGYHVFHKDFWLKNVNTLKSGTSFGEVAIMGKQLCTRNATIFCGKESFFAVLDKDNFQRIIGEHKERETMEKINFLRKVAIFSSFEEETIKTLIYFLQIKEFKYREDVIKEGEEINQIFIVKSGKIKVGIQAVKNTRFLLPLLTFLAVQKVEAASSRFEPQ